MASGLQAYQEGVWAGYIHQCLGSVASLEGQRRQGLTVRRAWGMGHGTASPLPMQGPGWGECRMGSLPGQLALWEMWDGRKYHLSDLQS